MKESYLGLMKPYKNSNATGVLWNNLKSEQYCPAHMKDKDSFFLLFLDIMSLALPPIVLMTFIFSMLLSKDLCHSNILYLFLNLQQKEHYYLKRTLYYEDEIPFDDLD